MPHLDHLTRHLSLAGLDVLDVGAGDGGFAARMAAAGARVTGIEIDAARVARARELQGARVAMIEGRAEALPVADASVDLVVFFFSLHHVPAGLHDAALAETCRVLRPGGWLYIAEPLPEGTMFELVRLVDDETEVRLAAQARLADMADRDARFERVARHGYTTTRQIPDLDRFVERMVAVDPARASRVAEVSDDLAARFAAARDAEGAAVLAQPCVACLFRLASSGPSSPRPASG